MKRAKKGQAGYVRYEKIKRFIITVIMFAIPIALFNIGLAINGTNKNVLTIMAVLSVLPAAKFAVDLIMIMMLKSAPDDIVRKTEKNAPDLVKGYELTVTATTEKIAEGRMPIDAVVICGNDAACFSTYGDRKQFGAFEKHIAKLMNADGYYGMNIKIFNEERAYIDRISNLNADPEKHRANIRVKEDEERAEAIANFEAGVLHTFKIISL